jgi:hypothetical protein
MRSCLVAILVLTACLDDDDPGDPGPPVVSAEVTLTTFEIGTSPLNLFFVVDRSGAMTEHESFLAESWALVAGVISNDHELQSNARIGLVFTDACGDTSPMNTDGCPVAGDFIEMARYADGVWERNYDDFAAALTCMGDFTVTACEESRPLAAALAAARDPQNADFFRPSASLHTVLISGNDDTSEGSVETWAEDLKAMKDNPSKLLVSVSAPGTATRLRAFAELFPSRNVFSPIEDQDILALFNFYGGIRDYWNSFCFGHPLIDVRPDIDGFQADCSVTTFDPVQNAETLWQPCNEDDAPESSTNKPCFWIDNDPWCDKTEAGFRLRLEWPHVLLENFIEVEARCAAVGTTL